MNGGRPRFLDDVEPVCEIIRVNFRVIKNEDKVDQLEPTEFGYLGVHFDTMTNESNSPEGVTESLACEIQVHTLCQNVWANQSHILAYKSLVGIPRRIQRTLHRTGALLEAADEGFNNSHSSVIGHPDFSNVQFLVELEKHFFRYVARDYDPELSLRAIACVLKAHAGDVTKAGARVREFVLINEVSLKSLYDQYGQIAERSAFLFQPEALAIFERLEADRYSLKATWIDADLPLDELVRMGQVWGIELEDNFES